VTTRPIAFSAASQSFVFATLTGRLGLTAAFASTSSQTATLDPPAVLGWREAILPVDPREA
jgi:hypothetical protein